MNKEKKLVPDIRFKGFNGDWEEKKIGEIAKLRNENINKEENFIVDIELENLVTDLGIIIGDISIRTKTNSIFRKNDILFGRLRPYLNKWWHANKDGIKSGEIWAIYSNSLDSKFLYSIIQNNTFLEAANLSSGTKMPRADWKNIKLTKIGIPNHLEQGKIGDFFSKLDNIIELQKKELENYKEYKKSMLQKMFPKMGKKTPEIRFQGFSEDWEEKKINYFIQDYINKTVVQNQYPVLTSSQKYGIVFQEDYFKDRQITTNNNIGYYILPKGYFTYRSRSDNGVFKFNRNNIIDNGIISYFYPVFKIINGSSDFFLMLLNNTIDKELLIESEGTGQRVLSLKKFKNIKIKTPSLQEQEKIGSFFKTLDDIITKSEEKLENYRNFKKSMLQKMFI